jgi:hypothetical protein
LQRGITATYTTFFLYDLSGTGPAPAPLGRVSNAPAPVPPPSGPVSPLIWGVNMDSRVSGNMSSAARQHVQIVRVAGDSPSYASYLQQIRAAGMQALVILRDCGVSDPTQRLAANKDLVATAQRIFGANARVYYEIGNENDLQCGLNASSYTARYNAMVPTLKQLAPNSWFGGPTNFQANPSYVAYFVHNATPKPDFISWHEYTCNSADSATTCIQHIASWTTHISNTRGAISAGGDAVPPIMITEWNYAPNEGVATDDKHNDSTFTAQWTTAAIKTLVDNHVFASMHFDVSDATWLIGTPQGQAFQSTYEHNVVGR